jgi:exonuclease VII small subunit
MAPVDPREEQNKLAQFAQRARSLDALASSVEDIANDLLQACETQLSAVPQRVDSAIQKLGNALLKWKQAT